MDYDDRDSKPFGADAPFAVVMFISNYLFCYDHPMRSKENRKQCNLVTLRTIISSRSLFLVVV